MFSIFAIQFSLPILFSFLIGLGAGLAIAALVYLIIVLATTRQKPFIVKTKANNITDEEVKQMIHEAQEEFKDKNLKGTNSTIAYCKDLSVELVMNIAKKYFPESKRPLYELSIDEVLMLAVYISNRLDEILDARGLRIFRRFKVSQIIGMTEVKEKIEANSIVKATKKYKIIEAFNAAKSVINVVNPVYWARKFVVNKSIDFTIKKLCMIVIATCGEETYKIYSKAVFDQVVEIDSGIEDLVNDIQNDITEIEEDAPKENEHAAIEAPKEIAHHKRSFFSKLRKKM